MRELEVQRMEVERILVSEPQPHSEPWRASNVVLHETLLVRFLAVNSPASSSAYSNGTWPHSRPWIMRRLPVRRGAGQMDQIRMRCRPISDLTADPRLKQQKMGGSK